MLLNSVFFSSGGPCVVLKVVQVAPFIEISDKPKNFAKTP